MHLSEQVKNNYLNTSDRIVSGKNVLSIETSLIPYINIIKQWLINCNSMNNICSLLTFIRIVIKWSMPLLSTSLCLVMSVWF